MYICHKIIYVMRISLCFLFILSYSIVSAQVSELDNALNKLDSAVTRLDKLATKAKSDRASYKEPEVKILSTETATHSPSNETNSDLPENYYTVELYYDRFPLPKGHQLYRNFPDLKETLVMGLFRYTLGVFSTEKQAVKFIENIKKKGFAGSVVQFEKGKRIIK